MKDELQKPPEIGSYFIWKTLSGNSYSGIVIEIDTEVVIVKCSDGKIRATVWR